MWMHSGIHPVVESSLKTDDILKKYEQFLASGKTGKRFLDLSWYNGFFLRLRQDKVSGVHDWPAELAKWLTWINGHSESIVWGSGTMGVNYPMHTSVTSSGEETFANHGSYLMDDTGTYPDQVRQMLGVFAMAQAQAGGETDVGKNLLRKTLEALFYKNAQKLAEEPKWEDSPPYTEAVAQDVVDHIFNLQHQEHSFFMREKIPFEQWAPKGIGKKDVKQGGELSADAAKKDAKQGGELSAVAAEKDAKQGAAKNDAAESGSVALHSWKLLILVLPVSFTAFLA